MKLYAKKQRRVFACILAVALLIPCFAALPVFATDTGAFYVAPSQVVKDGGTSGYYTTLAAAVKEVDAGGTVQMVKNHQSSTRENLYQTEGAKKSFTLDGSGTANATWTTSASCFKIGGSNTVVTVTNVTFDLGSYVGQIFEIDGANTLVLGDGVYVTASARAEDANPGNPLAFLGANNRVVIDGAVFAVNSPVVGGQDATSYVELRSGTVSRGPSNWSGANNSVVGYWNAGCTVAVNKTAVKVNDYVNNTMGRSIADTDFNLGAGQSCELVADSAYVTVGTDTTKHVTLADAVSAATDGATLHVYGDVFCPSALTLAKNLTLKGENTTAGLVGLNNNLLTLGNASLNMEDLTLQNAGSSAANATIVLGTAEGQTNTLTLNSGAKVVNTTGTSGNSNGNGINVAFVGTHSIVINDGAEITTGGTALRLETYAVNVTMNGGKITARYRGVDLASDNSIFTMNGGTIEVTTDKGSGGQGFDGGWCICTYQKKPTVTLNGGTLIAVKGDNTSIIGGVGDTGKLTVRQGVTMKYQDGTNEEQVLSDLTAVFSNNYMYLYLPDALTGAEDAAMAFATRVAIAEGVTVQEYGMVILPNAILKDGELTTQTDRVLKITDSALTANGYIECGVSNVAAGLAQLNSAMSGRAYVIVTVNLGGVTADVTLYGDVMSAWGAEFANAYKYYNADWASNETVKSVVDTFAALTVTE